MKIETLMPHLMDAATLYELTALDVVLLTALMGESTVLHSVAGEHGARLLRALAHILDAVSELKKKETAAG